MARFTNKVAVITGGNSGIGLATAKELATNGARVAIAGRDRTSLNTAVQAIGHDALGIQANVSNLSDIENLFEKVSEKFGKIDVLFVNAGISQFATLEQSDEAMFDRIVDINFKGSYFTVKYALPYLNDGASIVFTTAVAGKNGIPGSSIYGASKAALHALRRFLLPNWLGAVFALTRSVQNQSIPRRSPTGWAFPKI